MLGPGPIVVQTEAALGWNVFPSGVGAASWSWPAVAAVFQKPFWTKSSFFLKAGNCWRIILLWMIPTMTYYPDILSFYFTVDLAFYLASILTFFLPLFLAFYLASILPFFLEFYLASVLNFYRAFWILFGICSDILSGIYSEILLGILLCKCSDILSGILCGILSNISSDIRSGILSNICSHNRSDILSGSFSGILSGSRRAPQHPELAIWCSGPCMPHSIRSPPHGSDPLMPTVPMSWQAEKADEEEEGERGEEEKWGVPSLLKSRDPSPGRWGKNFTLALEQS